MTFEHGKQLVYMEDRYKLISRDGGETFALYDIPTDPGEARDLAEAMPGRVLVMREALMKWRVSCEK